MIQAPYSTDFHPCSKYAIIKIKKAMHNRIFFILLFLCSSSSWASFDAWKEQARAKYKMTKEEISSCAPLIIDQKAWDEFRRENFHVPVTLGTGKAVSSAIQEKLEQLEIHTRAAKEECEKVAVEINRLFPSPDKHPSGMTLDQYAQSILEAAGRGIYNKELLQSEELRTYNLPETRFASEAERRKLISKQIIQERVVMFNYGGPNKHFWGFSRLDIIFTTITTHLLAEIVPELFRTGVAGPYLTQCENAWRSYEQRRAHLQNFILFAFQMENELARWLHNALDREGSVTMEDYEFLKAHWGYVSDGEKIFLTQSGVYMGFLGDFFLAHQKVLIHELYLRGFQARDVDEYLHGEIVEDQLCWINILPIVNHYMSKTYRHEGLYGFAHPDLIRRSLRLCLEVNIPGRIQEALLQINATPATITPEEHQEEELEKEFIDGLHLQLVQLTSQCKEIQDRGQDELKSILARGKPTPENLEFIKGPKGKALVTNLSSIDEARNTLAMINTGQMLTDSGAEARDTLLAFFTVLTKSLETAEDLTKLKQWFQNRQIFFTQVLLLSHLVAIEQILAETFLTVQYEQSPHYGKGIEDEDKALFFLLLDQAETYLPGLISYINRTSNSLESGTE